MARVKPTDCPKDCLREHQKLTALKMGILMSSLEESALKMEILRNSLLEASALKMGILMNSLEASASEMGFLRNSLGEFVVLVIVWSRILGGVG
jgi:hypothetical protein